MLTVKDMSKFSPRRSIQQCYQGKLFSVIASQVVPFSQKRWYSAIGTKFGTFLARILLIAKPIPKFFGMSLTLLVGRVNLLLWSILMVDDSKTHLRWRRKLIRGLPLRKSLIGITSQNQTQIHSLPVIPGQNLLLIPIFRKILFLVLTKESKGSGCSEKDISKGTTLISLWRKNRLQRKEYF